MRSYTPALILSIGIFLAGLSLGYICVYVLDVDPKIALGVIMKTAPAQATVTRAETVSQTIQAIVEALAPQPKEYVPYWDNVRYVSTALGILSTNLVTAFGAAVTPLLPVLWHRRITPWLMRKIGRRYEPEASWRSYFRYITPLPPVFILGFNGFCVSLVSSITGFIDFMAPEMAGIICLAAWG